MSTRRSSKPAASPSKRVRRPYHHGHLRRALLDAAVAFLSKNEIVALNLQVVAKAAHVSPGAPYHHFADKVDLLAALATEGFAKLLDALRLAADPERAPDAKLKAVVLAYLDFAARKPAHYGVMFLRDIGDRARFADLHEVAGRSLALLQRILAARLPRASPAAVAARSVAVFSTCHGFASLHAAGVLANIPGMPSLGVLRSAAAAQIVAGLKAPASR